ncbi:MAG TPA: hypothetical protein VLT59_11885 [Steroidobacteraceae bacterium]|nr:hypothetical protein [Steroidobacteraceae bacterium]
MKRRPRSLVANSRLLAAIALVCGAAGPTFACDRDAPDARPDAAKLKLEALLLKHRPGLVLQQAAPQDPAE